MILGRPCKQSHAKTSSSSSYAQRLCGRAQALSSSFLFRIAKGSPLSATISAFASINCLAVTQLGSLSEERHCLGVTLHGVAISFANVDRLGDRLCHASSSLARLGDGFQH